MAPAPKQYGFHDYGSHPNAFQDYSSQPSSFPFSHQDYVSQTQIGGSSSQPRTDRVHSPINAFSLEELYTPDISDSLQENNDFWQAPNPYEVPVEQVATSPTKKKATRNRQKHMIQSDDAPLQTPWTTKKEIVLAKGWLAVSKNSKHGNSRKQGPESGAGDADYVQRVMIHYEIDTGLPFKLRRCWEILKDHPKWKEIAIPNFNTVSKGGSKRHKSTGSSSFNIESGEASINLNTNVDDNDEDEVQKIQRPDGQEQSESCWEKEREKKERLAFLEIKRREVECRERELEQQDMRFYLQSYDHLVGDQRKAMDEVRVEIKAKYNLQY
ncbi:glutathione S-transferase T3-like protein [Tanacetum coccineum]|uniref:Glutathione S-transferase T3-like protein n=1 Tax=Tanacetum coccineum TaxID=301880 RepID=A0ABQ4XCL1_9ASTR